MSNMMQITTVLGCKNPMLREGIKHILSGTRYQVRSDDLSCGKALSLRLYAIDPLLFIVDSNLCPAGMSNMVGDLKGQYANSRVVVLADEFDLEEMKLVIRAGADGYCLATTGCEALIKYLDLIMLGEVVFPSAAVLKAMLSKGAGITAREENASIAAPLSQGEHSREGDSLIRTLSIREAEILQCLMEGAPNKVIARKLEVAEATVKVHIKAILRKIRVANRTQAAMWAVNHLPSSSHDASWSQDAS